jgi:hypothetical protein
MGAPDCGLRHRATGALLRMRLPRPAANEREMLALRPQRALPTYYVRPIGFNALHRICVFPNGGRPDDRFRSSVVALRHRI